MEAKGEIGRGGFGEVHEATDVKTGEVAVKLESNDLLSRTDELDVYRALKYSSSDFTGIVNVVYHEREAERSVLVMTLLGRSLKENLYHCGGKFSAKTILMLGIQVVSRIQRLHNAGYSHEDISLENLFMGRNDPQTVYLVDFGLSLKLHGRWAPPRGRRSDLLSLGKRLIEMSSGWIPDSLVMDSGARGTETLEKVRRLCKGIPEVIRSFEMVFEREFLHDADYLRLRDEFQAGLDLRTNYTDVLFDWMRL